MTDEVKPTTPGTNVASAPEEDLIESVSPSKTSTELRRRVDTLFPATVGRKVLGTFVAAALVLGMVAGFLFGTSTQRGELPSAGDQAVVGADGGLIPVVPDGARLEAGVLVYTLGADFLTVADLETVGEQAAGIGGAYEPDGASALVGRCGRVEAVPETVPPLDYETGYAAFGSIAFTLVDAGLTQRISPDLDVFSASTLRGTVELARSCPTDADVTVRTEGVQTGIGDEYAVFIIGTPGATPDTIEGSISVIVRVGGQLMELTLTPTQSEVSDAVGRALRIAEVAVERLLAG